jgi:hypothetical protein
MIYNPRQSLGVRNETMTISYQQMLKHYEECETLSDQLTQKYSAELEFIGAELTSLASKRDEVLKDLSEVYFPDMGTQSRERLAQMTGFRRFLQHDPHVAMDREKVRLEKELAVIRADERYQRRKFLVGPNGEYALALEEAKSMLGPWEQECAKFENLHGFVSLLEVNYDTPLFSVSWLEPRYWKYWKWGDQICSALGMADFGDDVLPAYQKVAKERDKWREQVSTIQRRVDEVHEMAQKHDQNVDRLQHLPQVFLTQCQAAVAEFLLDADKPLLAEWNVNLTEPDRAVTINLRRVAGREAAILALKELREKGVQPLIKNLDERRAKYKYKQYKVRRKFGKGQRRWPESDMDKKFLGKAPKLEARAKQYRLYTERIRDYDDYDGFELTNSPELWWKEMTRKRPPSSMTSLRAWYDRHPESNPAYDRDLDHETDAAKAVASVAAAREFDDLGYLS